MKHTTKTGMTYEVKGYRELKTYNGYAYTYTLHINGKPACKVENRGDGSCFWVDWQISGAKSMWGTAGSAAATAALRHIATLPPLLDTRPLRAGEKHLPPLKVDMELWLGQIADDFVTDRKFGRLCKTKTVFRRQGDEEGRWMVVSRAYTPAFAEDLRVREKAVEFWNERGSAAVNRGDCRSCGDSVPVEDGHCKTCGISVSP